MTKYAIRLEKLPNQEIKVALSGKNCVMDFITRGDTLYLNKLLIEDVPMLNGIACLNGNDIFEYISTQGKLYFKDLNGHEKPRFEGFNDRWVLYYEVN